jgi:hypothetical protein
MTKLNKIGILGGGNIGSPIAKELENKGIHVLVHDTNEGELISKVLAEKAMSDDVHVILVDTPEPDNSFEINGIRYAPIKKKPKNPSNSRSGILLGLAQYMPYIHYGIGGGDAKARTLPSNIDIVTEYGLIELKQSKLTKWERDEVLRVFNTTYYKL